MQGGCSSLTGCIPRPLPSSLFSWRRGGIFRGKLRKSRRQYPPTVFTCFIYLGCLMRMTHKGCQNRPLTLGLRRCDIPTQEVFTPLSFCVKLIRLFISVSILVHYFEFPPISVHPCCKNKQEPQNLPCATRPEKNAASKGGDKPCLGGSGGLLLTHIPSS